MSNGHYNILFLSNRNTARSIFAEAVLNRVGRENFTGYSAGMHPADELDPLVCDILQVAKYRTDGLRPKHWKEFAGATARRSISSSPYAIRPQASRCHTGRVGLSPPIGAIPTRKN
jgi:hypothetical protein